MTPPICSLALVAYCGGEHESCGPGEECGGHSRPACYMLARYRVLGSDGWSQQYACGAHLEAMVTADPKCTVVSLI